MKRCPQCVDVELVASPVKGKDEVLDCCPRCRGVWFHRGQMERVLPGAVKGLHVPNEATPDTRRCPECTALMVAFAYPGTLVQVDMCVRCLGLWIDVGRAHEIAVVRAHVAETGEDVDGIKGQLIHFVNTALDWAMHVY